MLIRHAISLSDLLGKKSERQSLRANDLFSSNVSRPARTYEFFSDPFDISDILPLAVALSVSEVDTFFADVATFYPNVSPISAYMHLLLEAPDAINYDGDFRETRRETLLTIRRRIWIALAIAEAFTNSISNSSGEEVEVGYPLCRRSLSFALGRASYLYPDYPLEKLASRWVEARQLAKMDASTSLAASIVWLLNAAFGTSPVSSTGVNDAAEALNHLASGSMSLAKFSEFIVGKYPETSGFVPTLRGDYDRRMNALTQIVDSIRANSLGREFDALAIGFFCNTISPGSLAHIKFLARFQSDLPSLIIWYGFFCGISEEFDWKSALSGVGQKLSRDLEAHFNVASRPVCDIALEELSVLARGGLRSSVIKPVQQRAMLVSLLPGVDVYVRFPGQDEMQSSREIEQEKSRQLADRDRQVSRLLFQAQELLLQTSPTRRSPSQDHFQDSPRKKKTLKF